MRHAAGIASMSARAVSAAPATMKTVLSLCVLLAWAAAAAAQVTLQTPVLKTTRRRGLQSFQVGNSLQIVPKLLEIT